jgi:glycerophosphoryl diester phosphodiesterase
MVYTTIDKSNYNKKEGNHHGKNKVETLDDYMGNKDNKVFLLIFMEGCGPCNATRPEWKKLENVLSKDFLKRPDIIIASIDHISVDKLTNLATKPPSFPTMRFIANGGKTVENYEDSNIENKDRTIDSFVEWIKLKSGENNITKSENKTNIVSKGGKKTRKVKRGGKWSLKYKRSINCRRPKGFSQRQHCKYGRKGTKRFYQ